MPNPILIKTTLLAADKRIWKGAAIVLAAILTPFLLLVAVICSMLQGTANHNNAAVRLTFQGGNIPVTMPVEYKTYIQEMRSCFSKLDSAISVVEAEMEGGSLDSVRVKAVFYVLYFGQDHLRLRAAAARSFVDCFVTYETRTRTVTEYDENGEPYEENETYTVAVPIHDLPAVYTNVGNYVGREVTSDDCTNITEIYLRVRYGSFDAGADMSLEGGNGTHDLIKELAKDSEDAAHILPETELPMNATGAETLENVWALFETATRLDTRREREALFDLAGELAECQNLADWLKETPGEAQQQDSCPEMAMAM